MMSWWCPGDDCPCQAAGLSVAASLRAHRPTLYWAARARRERQLRLDRWPAAARVKAAYRSRNR